METKFSPLTDLLKEQTDFRVLSSVVKSTDEDTYVTRLGRITSDSINGLAVADVSSFTLFVSTREQMSNDQAISLDPTLWNYSVSEYTPEGATEPFKIKWLRAK